MYTIRNTERNNDTASEYETKSLLYLLGMREDSDEVSILFIDCLNDVTGCSKDFKKLWDVQSKGVSSLRPLTIGESLITLFSNYSSDDIDFSHFILIIPKLKLGYLNDENLKQFGVDNFFNYERIREGLTRKILNENDDFLVLPEYINTQLDAFLDKVLFVVADHHKSQYVKNIIDFVDKESKSKEFYTNIFDEIRNKQTALKNINIEDKEINSPSSLLKFNKHLKKDDIEILIVNRLIGVDLFDDSKIPIEYHSEIKCLDDEEVRSIIQDNNERLSRTFFNKNNKQAFWRLLEQIVNIVKRNRDLKPKDLFQKISADYLSKVYTLNEKSTIFFIALVKEGLRNDN